MKTAAQSGGGLFTFLLTGKVVSVILLLTMKVVKMTIFPYTKEVSHAT